MKIHEYQEDLDSRFFLKWTIEEEEKYVVIDLQFCFRHYREGNIMEGIPIYSARQVAWGEESFGFKAVEKVKDLLRWPRDCERIKDRMLWALANEIYSLADKVYKEEP